MRSPIICVVGQVNSGKTSFISCIIEKKIGEISNMTQDIIPYFINQAQLFHITTCNKLLIPSMILIDTPGHEPFYNMRITGINVSDFVIVIIDVLNGLEGPTKAIIQYLIENKKPFVLAINKIDNINGWQQANVNSHRIQDVLRLQTDEVKLEYEIQMSKIIQSLLIEYGLSSELYYRNKEVNKCISLVPFSALSCVGVPDLLMFVGKCTEKYTNLITKTDLELFCYNTSTDRNGFWLHCLLVQGDLNKKTKLLSLPDIKILNIHSQQYKSNVQECSASDVVSLLIPKPKHLIVTNTYLNVLNSQSITINDNNENIGLTIHAKSMDHAQAIIFLMKKTTYIDAYRIVIGQLHKADYIKASSSINPYYRCILSYTQSEKKEEYEDVKIMTANNLYTLHQMYLDWLESERSKMAAVCQIEILSDHIFRKSDPIICGVKVVSGKLKKGSELVGFGPVTSIQLNKINIDEAHMGYEVAIKIDTKQSLEGISHLECKGNPYEYYINKILKVGVI